MQRVAGLYRQTHKRPNFKWDDRSVYPNLRARAKWGDQGRCLPNMGRVSPGDEVAGGRAAGGRPGGRRAGGDLARGAVCFDARRPLYWFSSPFRPHHPLYYIHIPSQVVAGGRVVLFSVSPATSWKHDWLVARKSHFYCRFCNFVTSLLELLYRSLVSN